MGNRYSDVYFAELKGREFLDGAKEKINIYRDFCGSAGKTARWQLSVGAVYGMSMDGKNSWQVTAGGQFGELVQLKVNDYANLLKHQLILASQQRPAGIAKAINTDIKTLRNARVASLLVEYYLSDPGHLFEMDYVKAAFIMLMADEAFVVQDWETALGETMTHDEDGRPVRTGDLTQEVYAPWNVARDIGAPSPKLPWYIFSKPQNKFELCAKYPHLKRQILDTSYTLGAPASSGIRRPLFSRPESNLSDFIEVHKLIHIPTDACPKGRYTLFIEDQVLLDVPYPYSKKNFHRITDQDLIDSSFGHTTNYDLLGLEQCTDTLHSVVMNNQSTFGVGTIIGPKGSGITHQDLAKGLRYMEVDAKYVDMIKVLELVATPAEVFNYLAQLGIKKGELSGINSILRGDPQGALKGASGSAMALLQSQAIQFNSGVQKAFYTIMSSCGTGAIEILQDYADEPIVARIAGKSNSQAVKEFKVDKDMLKSVSTVVFEAVNPVLQTASGKLTVAQDLLTAGMLSSPKRYIEVLTTGNLNVLIEDDVAKEEAIIEENEELSEGKMVTVVLTENHKNHIAAHQAVISQPNAKKDLNIVNLVTQHILEHLRTWQQMSIENPALLIATGQEVLPVMPPPGMGGPMPGGPMPEGAAQAANPASSEPGQPSLPNPPVNPATGEQAPVQPGTSIQ